VQKSELRELRGLVERINRGDCVLVLGPHVAVRKSDRRPLYELFAEELDAEDPKNLRRAAELYLAKRRQDRDEVAAIMRDVYDAAEITDLHRDLAQLPFRICLNASWDNLMTRAFEQAGKAPVTAYYNYKPSPPQRLSAPTAERPLVYHLFGHHQDPPSLVLTEGDLIDYLVAFVKENPPLSDHVRAILDDPGASFLFLGFGFHQWYVRVLLHAMRVYKHNRPTMALEDQPFFVHPDHEQAVGFFSERLIDIRPLHSEEFASNLRAAYEEYAQKAAPKPVAARATSIEREGSEGVRQLRQRRPRRRGAAGARARSARRRRLAGQAGPAQRRPVGGRAARRDRAQGRLRDRGADRGHGPAHRGRVSPGDRRGAQAAVGGWDIAGDQQLRFLHPVRIGESPLHPRLKELHVIDAAEVDSLARSILEDWEHRQAVPA
jgi:hypothetical protein